VCSACVLCRVLPPPAGPIQPPLVPRPCPCPCHHRLHSPRPHPDIYTKRRREGRRARTNSMHLKLASRISDLAYHCTTIHRSNYRVVLLCRHVLLLHKPHLQHQTREAQSTTDRKTCIRLTLSIQNLARFPWSLMRLIRSSTRFVAFKSLSGI
jgi:hypothetical protein